MLKLYYDFHIYCPSHFLFEWQLRKNISFPFEALTVFLHLVLVANESLIGKPLKTVYASKCIYGSQQFFRHVLLVQRQHVFKRDQVLNFQAGSFQRICLLLVCGCAADAWVTLVSMGVNNLL